MHMTDGEVGGAVPYNVVQRPYARRRRQEGHHRLSAQCVADSKASQLVMPSSIKVKYTSADPC